MATSYTAEDLLEQVRSGGSLPSAIATGTDDATLLTHADAGIRDTLVPALLSVREEMYQFVFDVVATAGVAAYRINKRAAISRINTVQWVSPDGSVRNLARYDPKEIAELGILTASTGQASAYYLEGSRVMLSPAPSAAGTLRIRAMARPSRLCLLADLTKALSIDAVVGSGSLWALTHFTHGVPGPTTIRDVVAGTPSFEHLALDASTTVEDPDTFSIAKTSFSTPPAVGDYICAPDYTPFIQLPVELQPALVEFTITRLLRALGKKSEAADHGNEAQRLLSMGTAALMPRVDSANRKILGGPHWRRNRGNGVRGIW